MVEKTHQMCGDYTSVPPDPYSSWSIFNTVCGRTFAFIISSNFVKSPFQLVLHCRHLIFGLLHCCCAQLFDKNAHGLNWFTWSRTLFLSVWVTFYLEIRHMWDIFGYVSLKISQLWPAVHLMFTRTRSITQSNSVCFETWNVCGHEVFPPVSSIRFDLI